MVLALRNVLVLEDHGSKQSSTRATMWGDLVNALVDMGYERRRCEDVIGDLEVQLAKELGELHHHEAEELLFRHALKNLG